MLSKLQLSPAVRQNRSERAPRRHFPLEGVQRTLLIPLWARGVESRKARPIAFDPRASELLDDIAFDFRLFRRAYGTQLGCVLRGLLYDQWVGQFLARHPAGTVVELGAGLTTRFERLDNGRAHWIDVDLPDVIELRQRCFEKAPRRLSIGTSVVESGWLETITTLAPPPYFFVSEGMLMYLAEDDVRGLLVRLAKAFPGSELVHDSIGCVVVKNQHHHDTMKHMMDAPFRWGIDDVRGIEAWDPGLRVRDVADLAEIARRFPKRVPRHLRLAGDVMRVVLPSLTRSYRLSRVSLGAGN